MISMNVENLSGPRFELALEQLRSGIAVDFKNLNIWLNREEKIVEIRVRSSWDIRNLSVSTATSDLETGKDMFSTLIENQRFAELVKNSIFQFLLVNDYGTGMVEICRLIGSHLIWAKGINPSKR